VAFPALLQGSCAALGSADRGLVLDVDNFFEKAHHTRIAAKHRYNKPHEYTPRTYDNMDSLGGTFGGGDPYVLHLHIALSIVHAILTPAQQDANHAPGPAGSRHAERAHARREAQRTLL
jgi:hypothetical protein